jgi:hypothetical protein
MTDLSMSMFLTKDDLDRARAEERQKQEALDEALITSRLKAARVVQHMERAGTHWLLTVQPNKK